MFDFVGVTASLFGVRPLSFARLAWKTSFERHPDLGTLLRLQAM